MVNKDKTQRKVNKSSGMNENGINIRKQRRIKHGIKTQGIKMGERKRGIITGINQR